MRIDAFFAPPQVQDVDVEGRPAVVIDVLRATSCITEAIANGARGIFPTESIDEASKLGASLDRDATLLCGERKGLRIDGFDLGNSPGEFSADRVGGKQLVMTTSNGTRAFLAAEEASEIIAASFLNLSAVVKSLGKDPNVAIICAGKENRFSLDDVVCAGHIVRRVVGRRKSAALNDAARAASDLAAVYKPSAAFFSKTAAGRALEEVGLGSDLALCAELDKHTIVPRMYERTITAPRG